MPSSVEQRLVGVHAGTVDAENRLRHEGRVQAVLGGDRTDNPFEGDGVVGGGQGVGIFEVDLMLALGDLMMGGLDLKAHGLEGLDDLAATIDTGILGIEVEIAGDIAGDGGGQAVLIFLEQEKFGLGADVHGVADFFGLGQDPLEVDPRAAGKGGAVGLVDVADDTGGGDAVLIPPGQDGKGVVIGLEIHVRLVDADKALDGGTVKHHLAVQRLFDLALRNGNILHKSEDIDKLKAKKLNIFVLNNLHYFFSGHFDSLLFILLVIYFRISTENRQFAYSGVHHIKLRAWPLSS